MSSGAGSVPSERRPIRLGFGAGSSRGSDDVARLVRPLLKLECHHYVSGVNYLYCSIIGVSEATQRTRIAPRGGGVVKEVSRLLSDWRSSWRFWRMSLSAREGSRFGPSLWEQ
jgi:hypothetical protein